MNETSLFTALSSVLEAEGIPRPVPLAVGEADFFAAKLRRCRLPFVPRSALLFLIPYYTVPGENISAYAVGRDYHILARELEEGMRPLWSEICPEASFRLFCDDSPLRERACAVRAGLGVLGDNGLLISPVWGSYVFLAEVLSDLEASAWGVPLPPPASGECLHCGACARACPTGCLRTPGAPCLSALTQARHLTPDEEALVRRSGQVWGCDVCQSVCPQNIPAGRTAPAVTPVAFFHRDVLPRLDREALARMTEADLALRAYAWRGRETVARNLALTANADPPERD